MNEWTDALEIKNKKQLVFFIPLFILCVLSILLSTVT